MYILVSMLCFRYPMHIWPMVCVYLFLSFQTRFSVWFAWLSILLSFCCLLSRYLVVFQLILRLSDAYTCLCTPNESRWWRLCKNCKSLTQRFYFYVQYTWFFPFLCPTFHSLALSLSRPLIQTQVKMLNSVALITQAFNGNTQVTDTNMYAFICMYAYIT